MLDFFTIFSKGGIVLWCFQGTQQLFTPSVNALIKSVILQVRKCQQTDNFSYVPDHVDSKIGTFCLFNHMAKPEAELKSQNGELPQ